MPSRGETFLRRRLANELRRLREATDLTIDHVAAELECSASKISRIETGQVSATPRDVRDMLQIYGISGQYRNKLVQLARDARQKGWWHEYSDLSVAFVAEYESEAASIRMYSALLVPGLLQTEDYARAVLRAILVDLEPEQIERRARFRMARQPLLTHDDSPTLDVVLDEAALRRHVGGRQVMRQQLHRLVQIAELPSVTLRVLPFRAGEHIAMDGEFTVISFPDPADPEISSADPDVVYLEHTTTDLYLDDAKATLRYNLIFDQLRDKTLKPHESVEFLVGVANDL